ncbi:MAG: GntR family transcriptional regulator [Anaerolineaceae bacterium]
MNEIGIPHIKLEEKSFIPLYYQVEAALKEMIEGVKYSPGDQIPSERELSEMLGVSRMTVRRAVENLIKHGLLERRSTQGTFVRQPEVMRMVGKDFTLGLTQMVLSSGAQPASQLLQFGPMLSTQKIAERLGLMVGEKVIVLRRLRLVNNAPFCIETSYLPEKLIPELKAEDFKSETSSLYAILRERYDIQATENDETLKISYATADEALHLGMKIGSPVLLMRSVVFDQRGQRIEYVVSVNHPERVIFRSTTRMIAF